MTHLPSASGLERVFACPASQVYEHLRNLGSLVWARRGTVIHRFLERVPQVGVDTALEEVPEDLREACACIEVEKLPVDPGCYASEVAVAFDLATGSARELCRGNGREESYALARPGELVGTMDVLGLTEDAVVVCDYKTGFKYFGPVDENPQLMFYALAASRAYGRKWAKLAIVRINQEGQPFFIWAEVGPQELAAFEERLRALDERIGVLKFEHAAGEELQPVTGDHCQYCPAVHACPAWMKLARAMTSPEDDTAGLPPLSVDTAPLYVEALKRGGKVLERIEKALALYAEASPIDLGGEWVYGPHPFPNREWDVRKALPVLQRELGPEVALSAIRAEVVEKWIYEAFRERKKAEPKLAMGKETERVMEALKAEGGLNIRYSFPVGRFKAKPEHAAIFEAAGRKLLPVGGEPNGEARLEEEAGQRDGDACGEAGGR